MLCKIKLPHLGEGIDKIELALWHIDEGASIKEGDDLLEVVTDKASFNIPAPASGSLIEKKVFEGQEIKEGEILGFIKK